MPFDLSFLDRVTQSFRRSGTSIYIDTYDDNKLVNSFEFTRAAQSGPVPNEVYEVAKQILANLAQGGTVRPRALPLQMIARSVWGSGGNVSPSVDASMMLCEPAPGSYKAVQLCVHGLNTAGLTASYSPSSVLGGGIQARNQANNANLGGTKFTWGTQDINDIRNPGGGALYGSITNSSGSFSYPAANTVYTQGEAWTDWMFENSFDRVDIPGAKPMTFFKWYAPRNNTGAPVDVTVEGSTVSIPAGQGTPGFRNRTGEVLTGRDEFFPETRMAYYASGNIVGSASINNAAVAGGASGTIASDNTTYTVCTTRYLVDTPQEVIVDTGDSHIAGGNADLGQQYGAGIGGWPVMLRDLRIAKQQDTDIVRKCLYSDNSRNYLQRMRKAIQNRLGTLYIIQVGSLNDYNASAPIDQQNRLKAYADAIDLVRMATVSGATPAVVIPWRKSGSAQYYIDKDQVFRDQMRAAGVPVVDIPAIICNADRYTLLPSCVADADHYNREAHRLISIAALWEIFRQTP